LLVVHFNSQDRKYSKSINWLRKMVYRIQIKFISKFRKSFKMS
jgi:hypothetical protein